MQPKWIIVAVLFLVNAINYADRTSITAVYALLKVDLGLSDVALGAMGSLFLWSYAFASPLGGYCGDRFSRGRIIVWSLAGWSLVTLLCGLAVNTPQLLTLRVLLGLVEALYLPAAFALVAEYHEPDTRGTAISILTLGNLAGMVGGGALAGYLGQQYGWQSPLLVLGAFGLLLAGVCRVTLPQSAPTPAAAEAQAPFFETVRALSRVPTVLILTAAGLLASIGSWIFINWLPLYFHEAFAMSVARAGLIGSSVQNVAGSAALAVGGFLSDRMAAGGRHRRMWMHAVLITCAAPVPLVFLVTKELNAVLVSLVVYAILRTAADLNIIPVLCDLVQPHQRSTVIGLTNMLNTMAGGAGIFVAGTLKANVGLAGIFASLSGILALDAALLFLGCVLYLKRDLAAART